MLYLKFYLYVSFSELNTFFSSPEPHGWLIVYPCTVACRPSDIFYTETALPIEARPCAWVRDESFFAASGSNDQVGRHVHIW